MSSIPHHHDLTRALGKDNPGGSVYLKNMSFRGLSFDRVLFAMVIVLALISGASSYLFLLPQERQHQMNEFLAMRELQARGLVDTLLQKRVIDEININKTLDEWSKAQPFLKTLEVYNGQKSLIYSWQAFNTRQANSPSEPEQAQITTRVEFQGHTVGQMISRWDTDQVAADTRNALWRMVSFGIGLALLFVIPIMLLTRVMLTRHLHTLTETDRRKQLRSPMDIMDKKLIAHEVVDVAKLMARTDSLHRRDIAIKQNSQKLQGYLAAIIANALDGIMILNDNRQVISLNPMAQRIIRVSEAKARGKELEELVTIKSRRLQDDGLATTGDDPAGNRSKDDEPGFSDIEILDCVRESGEEYHLKIANTCFSSGGLHYKALMLSDISDQVRHNRFLADAKQHSDDIARTKSHFLAMMSHEIRTPLNGIIGALQLLESTTDSYKRNTYIQQGMKSAESLKHITGNLLDISSIEAGNLILETEAFSPRAIVQDELSLAESLLDGKKLTLDAKFATMLPKRVEGDSGKIRQVLRNIISNAIKFTDTGSVIVHLSANPTDSVRTSSLIFAVQDTGIGIPENMSDKVFGAFDSIDIAYVRSTGGAGLGMAISKRIVEAMNGKIGFKSKQGKGTVFWFQVTLPIAQQEPKRVPVRSTSSQVKPLRGKKLLIVEDNLTNSLIAKHMLEAEGCVVMTADNGVEALEMVDDFPFDGVLMDVAMPKLDGLECTRQIRNRDSATLKRMPIIAMTAHAAKQDILAGKEVGMSDYLTKPVDRASLIETLNRWLVRPQRVKPINGAV